MTESETRAGFVAVIGAPNAGKSTLINKLVGGKVSIVSPKVQTTRSIVRGIAVHGSAQIVFVDTPGLFTPRKRLERAMVAAAWAGRDEADMALLLVDASGRIGAETRDIISRLKGLNDKQICAAALNALYPFDATFMISALRGDGANDLLDWLAGRLPAGPFLYPEDQMSDMPARQLAAEITREKLFRRMHDELPYALAVETESWEPRSDGSVMIRQVIFVARESHRAIILGKGGSVIGQIGEDARKEIETIIGARAHLKLFVKVNASWAEDPDHYRQWGLDFQA